MKRFYVILISIFLFSCDQGIDPNLLPKPCFTIENETIYWGEYVQLNNCTENSYSRAWDFGDGYSITEYGQENPLEYRYMEAGEYTITLHAFNDDGRDSISKKVTVLDGCRYDADEFDFTFGIDHNNPSKYLEAGTQSDLSQKFVDAVITEIGEPEQTIAYVKKVYQWINQNFTYQQGYWTIINETTANQLFESKTIYNSHTKALALSSVLRKLGFPTLMVETASIQWAYKYVNHTNESIDGYVLTEVYLNNQWTLIDNGLIVENYNALNPFISITNKEVDYHNDGLFVVAKGIDAWEYYERNNSNSHNLLIDFTSMLKCYKEIIGSVEYEWK